MPENGKLRTQTTRFGILSFRLFFFLFFLPLLSSLLLQFLSIQHPISFHYVFNCLPEGKRLGLPSAF